MFPDSHDTPAFTTEFPVHHTVTRLVTGEFPFPEGPVVRWHGRVLWAGVPEAAVHKHRNTRIWENKIRFSEYRLIPPPAGDAMFAEQLHQRDFRFHVPASANPRHDLRPFSFGEYVRHCSIRE